MADMVLGGPDIHTTFEMDRKTLIRFCHVATRGCRIVFIVCGSVLFLLGVTSGDMFSALFPTFVLIALYGFIEFMQRQRVDRGFGYLRSGTLAIGIDRFSLHTPLFAASYDWAMFDRVRRRSGFWLIRMKSGGFLPLPVTTFDQADTERFEALLRMKGVPIKR
jgi:hypothetical protein